MKKIQKIQYKKRKYVPLKEARERFASEEEFIQIFIDGEIIAEGRHETDQDEANREAGIIAEADDGTEDLPERKKIKPHTWETYKLDLERNMLTKSHSTRHGASGFSIYFDICVQSSDLEKIGNENAQQQAPVKTEKENTERKKHKESHIYIGQIIVEMMEKTEGKFPENAHIWAYIKRNVRKIDTIRDIEASDYASPEKIIWKNSRGREDNTTRKNFDKIVRKYRKNPDSLPKI